MGVVVDIVVAGQSNVSAVASGNIGPLVWPDGSLPDDIGLVFCCQHDNVVATISGGVATIVDATNGTTALRTFWAWRRFVAGDTQVTILRAAGDTGLAQMITFRGVVNTGNPYEANGVTAGSVASATVSAPAITTITARDMIVFFGGTSDDSSYSGYTGTNPVFSELTDQLTTLGLDDSFSVAVGIKTDASTTGARTSTASRSTGVGNGHLIALKPQAAFTNPDFYPDTSILQAVRRKAVR